MKWILIRHGLTQGNLERRYIGCRTDESLCPEGKDALHAENYPAIHHVFVSPLHRCIETAALLYPEVSPEVIPDFRECDFGGFEGLNYADLNGREDYQAWIDSGGELPFPGGESRKEFTARCVQAFESLLARNITEDSALIVHGGTIMAIMEKFARPAGGYYDFQVKCGEGYVLHLPSPSSADTNYQPLLQPRMP